VQALKQVIVAIRAKHAPRQRIPPKRRGESPGRRQEAVESKGEWPRPRRFDPFAALARWWRRLRPQAARLHAKKSNGKVKSLAFSRALFERAVAGEIEVIEGWQVAPAKTKRGFFIRAKN